jgi:hypothetical protein
MNSFEKPGKHDTIRTDLKSPDSTGDEVGDRINYLSQMIVKIGAKPAETYAQPRHAHDAELQVNKMIAEMNRLQNLSPEERRVMNVEIQRKTTEAVVQSDWQ